MLEYCNRAVDPLPLTWSAFDIAGRDEMTSGPPQGFSESIMSHAPPVCFLPSFPLILLPIFFPSYLAKNKDQY